MTDFRPSNMRDLWFRGENPEQPSVRDLASSNPPLRPEGLQLSGEERLVSAMPDGSESPPDLSYKAPPFNLGPKKLAELYQDPSISPEERERVGDALAAHLDLPRNGWLAKGQDGFDSVDGW